MRTGLTPKQFFNAMKKKPALQAILNAFEAYTVEELEQVDQPLWIRKVLIEMKQEELGIGNNTDEESALRAEQIADMMMNAAAEQEPQEPEKYEVLWYKGSDFIMNGGMTGSLQAEVKYDDCLYVIDVDPAIEKYVVGMDSFVGILTEVQWNRLLQSSSKVGMMTKPEYSEFASKQSAKKLTKTPEQRDIIAQTAGPRSYVDPNSTKGFEIIRHGITYK